MILVHSYLILVSSFLFDDSDSNTLGTSYLFNESFPLLPVNIRSLSHIRICVTTFSSTVQHHLPMVGHIDVVNVLLLLHLTSVWCYPEHALQFLKIEKRYPVTCQWLPKLVTFFILCRNKVLFFKSFIKCIIILRHLSFFWYPSLWSNFHW